MSGSNQEMCVCVCVCVRTRARVHVCACPSLSRHQPTLSPYLNLTTILTLTWNLGWQWGSGVSGEWVCRCVGIRGEGWDLLGMRLPQITWQVWYGHCSFLSFFLPHSLVTLSRIITTPVCFEQRNRPQRSPLWLIWSSLPFDSTHRASTIIRLLDVVWMVDKIKSRKGQRPPFI